MSRRRGPAVLPTKLIPPIFLLISRGDLICRFLCPYLSARSLTALLLTCRLFHEQVVKEEILPGLEPTTLLHMSRNLPEPTYILASAVKKTLQTSRWFWSRGWIGRFRQVDPAAKSYRMLKKIIPTGDALVVVEHYGLLQWYGVLDPVLDRLFPLL